MTREQLQKQERLTALRQKLQLGTYTVHPRIIADAIIARGLEQMRMGAC